MSQQLITTQALSASLHQLQGENADLKKYLTAQRSVIDSLERRVGRSLDTLVTQLDRLPTSLNQSEAWQGHLDLMQHEINSLCDLIADAMLLQKLEAGKVEVKIEPLNLDPLIESATRHLLEVKNGVPVRLVREVKSPLPLALADQDLLEAALTDLLSRSLKYSDPGSPVVLEVEPVGNHVLLQVTAQRFAPSGDRSFATEMVLCCRRIEVQNGQISCQHHPDGLQTVVVALPTASS